MIDARDRLETAWEALLEDGTCSGAFVERPPVLVKGILGLCNYSYLWFRSTVPMPYDAVADAFVDRPPRHRPNLAGRADPDPAEQGLTPGVSHGAAAARRPRPLPVRPP